MDSQRRRFITFFGFFIYSSHFSICFICEVPRGASGYMPGSIARQSLAPIAFTEVCLCSG